MPRPAHVGPGRKGILWMQWSLPTNLPLKLRRVGNRARQRRDGWARLAIQLRTRAVPLPRHPDPGSRAAYILLAEPVIGYWSRPVRRRLALAVTIAGPVIAAAWAFLRGGRFGRCTYLTMRVMPDGLETGIAR